MKINLFCLPFAGGSKYSYSGFSKAAPSYVEVVPIELPGRGARFRERLLGDLEVLAEDVFRQLEGRLDAPYALYGHSMGSLLAYLVVKRIVQNNLAQPLALFVSGKGGPAIPEKDEPLHLLPREAFLDKLRELDGTPKEVFEQSSLMNFFEPILRADFRCIETYTYRRSEPFGIPIVAMIGDQEKISYEEVSAWQLETTQVAAVIPFPGKHFFIFDHTAGMMEIIGEKLRATLPGKPAPITMQ